MSTLNHIDIFLFSSVYVHMYVSCTTIDEPDNLCTKHRHSGYLESECWMMSIQPNVHQNLMKTNIMISHTFSQRVNRQSHQLWAPFSVVLIQLIRD